MKKEIRNILTPNTLQVREKGEGAESRTIYGYAILFDTYSDVFNQSNGDVIREKIDKGAVSVEFLNEQDIKMTMFHDRQLILARSKNGKGTLSYGVDEKGVYFEFDAPNTVDGDKAIELVKRGDIMGCSFAFGVDYSDPESITREIEVEGDTRYITYIIRNMTGVYDFTLAADPAYPDTSVSVREIEQRYKEEKTRQEAHIRQQIKEMREIANTKL